MKIAYYPGCTMKTKAANLEIAAVEALNVLGVEFMLLLLVGLAMTLLLPVLSALWSTLFSLLLAGGIVGINAAKMACGLGACLGCAVRSRTDRNGYRHACLHGPVFHAHDLCW